MDGTIEDNIKELKQTMALTKDNHTKANVSSLVKVGVCAFMLRRKTLHVSMEKAQGSVYHLLNCTMYIASISILCKSVFTMLIT